MSHTPTLTSPPTACLSCVSHRTAVLLILAFSNAFTAYQCATGFAPLVQLHGLVGWLIVSATFVAAIKPWPRVYLVGVYAYLALGIAAGLAFVAWLYSIGPDGLARFTGMDQRMAEMVAVMGEVDAVEIKRLVWSHLCMSMAVGVVVQTVVAWPGTLIRYAPVLRWEWEEKRNADFLA